MVVLLEHPISGERLGLTRVDYTCQWQYVYTISLLKVLLEYAQTGSLGCKSRFWPWVVGSNDGDV